ncbi:MAG: peptide-methionine (S)-S-oxide reductase MsrA [Saprospiraceae bacterium]
MKLLPFLIAIMTMANCNSQSRKQIQTETQKEISADLSKAYFASGCFWCVEIVFESVKGVEEVISGYSGGHKKHPTYREVGNGGTGHAEAVEVYYNSDIVSYETLVKVYYASQNPTTFGQKPDFGDAYRSMIYYQNKEEKDISERYKVNIAADYNDPIVTEIVPFDVFWPAEKYHQDYEKKNPNQPYVRGVSIPRLKRFQAKLPELLKDAG